MTHVLDRSDHGSMAVGPIPARLRPGDRLASLSASTPPALRAEKTPLRLTGRFGVSIPTLGNRSAG